MKEIEDEQIELGEQLEKIEKDDVNARQKVTIYANKLHTIKRFMEKRNLPGIPESFLTIFFGASDYIEELARELEATRVNIESVNRWLEILANTMNELDYSFHAKVLNALDYGIPQKRERIYMICFRNDLNIQNFQFPKPFELNTFVKDLLLPDSEVEHLVIDRKDLVMTNQEIEQTTPKTVRLGIVGKGGQGERIYSTRGIAITLSAYGGGIFAKTGGYLVNGKTRKLHPRECARIMGYPDSYKVHPSTSQAYKQFGNSVVINVLQYIAYNIGSSLNFKPY